MEKTNEPVGFKSFPPQQHGRHRGAQLPRQDAIGQPFGGAQYNVDAENNTPRRTAMTTECHQLFSLRLAKGESGRRRKWHCYIQYAVIPLISKAISDT